MMKGKPERDTPSLDLHPVLLEQGLLRTGAAEVAAACRQSGLLSLGSAQPGYLFGPLQT